MSKTIFISIFLTITCLQSLSAMSIGRDGEPYYQENIQWQPVKYENNDNGFLAALPGSPTSGMSSGYIFSYSIFQDVHYEIKASLNGRYQPPKKESDFIKQIEEVYSDIADVIPVPSTQKTIKYMADLYFQDSSKVVRIHCSSNQLYWAIVEGEDLSLTPLFFDTIKITN